MSRKSSAIVKRFGRNVAAARAHRGIRQAELATRAGLDASYVSLIEAGKRVVGIDTAERLALALNAPLGALLTAAAPFAEASDAA